MSTRTQLYLKQQEKKKELLKSIDMKDILQMEEQKEKELYRCYHHNSFYNIHMLLRYQSNELATSYVRPITRALVPDKKTRSLKHQQSSNMKNMPKISLLNFRK